MKVNCLAFRGTAEDAVTEDRKHYGEKNAKSNY